MKIIPQFNLQNHNTLRLSCVADFWIEVEHPQELRSIFQNPEFKDLPFHVLGEGSNIILSQSHFAGMVLKLSFGEKISLIDQKKVSGLSEKNKAYIAVSADYNWHNWVEKSLEFGFGLENLALIPGTVGASLVQNIGAYGVEVSQFIDSCKVFNTNTHEFEHLSREQCQFSYRDSLFKKNHHYIIIEVLFALDASNVLDAAFKPNIIYPDLQKYFAAKLNSHQTPTAHEVLAAVVQIRQQKLPNPKELANVGSFFKNPIIAIETYQELSLNLAMEPPFFKVSDTFYKIPAAWLIEKAGFKGVIDENGVGISEKHALVLINYQSNSGVDVLHFAAKIQQKVKELFLIDLEIEPLII